MEDPRTPTTAQGHDRARHSRTFWILHKYWSWGLKKQATEVASKLQRIRLMPKLALVGITSSETSGPRRVAQSLRRAQATAKRLPAENEAAETFPAHPAVPLEAGLRLLNVLSFERRTLSFTEIRTILDLDDAAARDVIGALERHGFLAHDARRSLYMAGIRGVGLAHSYTVETPLVRIAIPALARIRDQSNETTILTVRWGDYRVNIAQAPGSHLFNRSPQPMKPLHTGSGGKILLASMSDAELGQYIERLKRGELPDSTSMDPQTMIELVREIRKTGIAEGFSERTRESASFAAAIRDAEGAILGALVVSIPLHRYQDDLRHRVIQLLMNGAEEISDELLRSGQIER